MFLSLLRHFKRIQGPITNIKHSITHTHRNQSSHKASYKQPQALRPRQAHSSRIYRHYFATAFPRPSFALSHVPCRARHLRMTRSIILAALVLAACVCSAQGEAPARGVLRPRESEPPPQLLLPRSSLPFPHSKHPSCLSPQQSYHSPPQFAAQNVTYSKSYSTFYAGVSVTPDATLCKQIIGGPDSTRRGMRARAQNEEKAMRAPLSPRPLQLRLSTPPLSLTRPPTHQQCRHAPPARDDGQPAPRADRLCAVGHGAQQCARRAVAPMAPEP